MSTFITFKPNASFERIEKRMDRAIDLLFEDFEELDAIEDQGFTADELESEWRELVSVTQ
ncbi:hypothetical protein M8745_18480 [Lutimaribacter sp. EGI FJ00014]|nr:hypothetical protein [Lutimaribacter sp. EGI FJ00014]